MCVFVFIDRESKETSSLLTENLRISGCRNVFVFVLFFSVESTALRLITALGSSEVQPQFTRFLNDPKTVLSAESEELNRALILTLARATHVTGSTQPGSVSLCLKVYLPQLSLFPVHDGQTLCVCVKTFLQGQTPSMGLGVKTFSRPS